MIQFSLEAKVAPDPAARLGDRALHGPSSIPLIILLHTRMTRGSSARVASCSQVVPAPRAGTYIDELRHSADVHRGIGLIERSSPAAANAVAESGISVELIDLRSLSLWDREAGIASVKNTARVIVGYEDSLSGVTEPRLQRRSRTSATRGWTRRSGGSRQPTLLSAMRLGRKTRFCRRPMISRGLTKRL
jgi:hypothetical protein